MEKELVLPAADAVCMSADAAEKLLKSANGDAALLYIYILKNHGMFSASEASALGLKNGVKSAMDALAGMGLTSRGASIRREREDVPPEYSADEIYDSVREGGKFAGLVPELERILGKPLSAFELKVFYGIYDYLGLPTEVILLLVSYCVEETERKQGRDRRPSARSIEAEAYSWARNEAFTLEAAEAHIARMAKVRSGAMGFAGALKLSDRALGATEAKYLRAWAEMGFDTPCVLEAYDRTVLKKGSLNWAYMNSILKSWHEKGLHNMDEIRDGDSIRRQETEDARTDARDDVQRMRRLLDKLKDDGEGCK